MKLAKLQIALMAPFFISGISACTTVDLSQVAIEQPQSVAEAPKQNVVERASHSLTSMFRTRGWCKGGPDEKTQTATNVLLNGIGSEPEKTSLPATIRNRVQLSSELNEANEQIIQTTKAAEVFLLIADEMAELNNELSQLETALLSAREAENRFAQALEASGGIMPRRKMKTLSTSVNNLKIITDAYGDRIRQQIAMQASSKQS